MADDTLEILIDVRSRLDDLVKAQGEFRRLQTEAHGAGKAIELGFGIETVHRGIDLLKEGLRESVGRAFEMAEAIKDGSRNLEISAEAYQVLGNAIRDAGGDAQLLTQAVSNSNRSLVEARNLGSAAAGAYRGLGLDIAKLESLPAEQRFMFIGRAVLQATDKTQAYSDASHILGTRNLPTLLGALKDLAEQGWDKVTEAQKKAGLVMTDDTIERLEAAKKSIERFKQSVTIGVGESIAYFGALSDSLKKDFLGTMRDIAALGPQGLNFGPLAMRLAKDNPAEAKPPGDNGSNAQQVIAQKEALAQAEYNLASATLHRQTVDADPNITAFNKEAHQLALMEQELGLRQKLIEVTKAMPIEGTETQRDRDLKIQKLEEQNNQLQDQVRRLRTQNDTFDKEQDSRDKFSKFNEQNQGSQINLSGAARLGGMDWVTSLGTAAERVSSTVQSTLGATVQGISDGIYGWVTHTKSFGSAMVQLGGTVFRSFLDAIVQMGVQWLVTQALVKTGMLSTHALGEVLRVQRTIATAEEGAAAEASLAPAAAAASILSFGAAALLGVVALIAALAIFRGFSAGGYTGDGSPTAIAGVTHGQEFVLNAGATDRLGLPFLNAVNSGAPVSLGAMPPVGASAFNAAGNALGGALSGRNIHVYLDRSAWLDAVQQDLTGIAHEVYDKRSRS